MSIPLIAAAIGLIFHFGGLEVRRFERLAADDLRSGVSGDKAWVSVKTKFASLLGGPLGELDTVVVNAGNFACESMPLFTEPWRSTAGTINELRINLRDFDMAGLHVDRLEAVIPNCRFDYAAVVRHHRFMLSRSGVGTVRVWVSETALAAFGMHKYPEVTKAAVRIDKDKVFVEATGRLYFIKADVSLIAGLGIAGASRLELTYPRFFVDDRRPSPEVAAGLLRILTPAIDLDKDLGLHGAITMQGLRLRDGVMEAWGTATLPNRTKSDAAN